MKTTPFKVFYNVSTNTLTIGKVIVKGKEETQFEGTWTDCVRWCCKAKTELMGWVVEWEKDQGPFPMYKGDKTFAEGTFTVYPTMEEAFNEYYEGGES